MKPGDLVKIFGDPSGEVCLLLEKREVDHFGESRTLCIIKSNKGEYRAWQYDLEKVTE
tara:strand:- start:383 stop:556 length:174 start_codon:yes stop_codon:yes gene_type:complete